MKVTQALARSAANDAIESGASVTALRDRNRVRTYLDANTMQELSSQQLDKLTNMVQEILRERLVAKSKNTIRTDAAGKVRRSEPHGRRGHVQASSTVDPIDLLDIQAKRDEYPDEAERVEEILELLGDLRAGKDKVRIAGSLTAALSRYKWRQQVSHTAEGLRVVSFATAGRELTPGEAWEYGTVSYLLALVPYPGRWPRICADTACPEWFAARARGRRQMFCSDKCKQRVYEQDPARREKKRERMRGLYETQTNLARKVIGNHPHESVPALIKRLEKNGVKRSWTWVRKEKALVGRPGKGRAVVA